MRPSWKLPYIAPFFFSNGCKKKSKILTNKRNSLIPFNFSDKKIIVHNGSWYKKVPITRFSINFKLGEFAPSRLSTKYTHLKKLRKKGLKKKK